jgi:RNA polymerase sigma factor (sigma-70 family)
MNQTLAQLESILDQLKNFRNDEKAWADLYTGLWPWVFANIYRYLRGTSRLAEDASQDVFVRLLRYCEFHKVQDPVAFRAYLRIVCKNVARDYYTKDIKRSEIQLRKEGRNIISSEEEEIRIKIDNVLANLDDMEKRLIQLTMDGYTMQEIIEETDWSYSNTAIRLYRLKKKVRDYL